MIKQQIAGLLDYQMVELPRFYCTQIYFVYVEEYGPEKGIHTICTIFTYVCKSYCVSMVYLEIFLGRMERLKIL